MTIAVQRSFDDLGAALFEVPFCVLDLETTGGSPADSEITEIGAVRYLGGEPTGTFQTLVDPGVPIPPFITVLTGITHAMVVEAPRIEEALPAFLEFLGDAVIVGHNVRFDLSFLNAAATRLGYGKLPHRSADTVALARRLVRTEVRNLKLSSLAAHFRSPTQPTHRALDDARATAHVFWSLLERAGTLGVTHLEDLMMLPTARGTAHYRKITLADSLPRRPGVYLFTDRAGEIIYVGKAKNLRTRVRSYFYGDTRRSVGQMLRDVTAIDHRVCRTELEAEVTELRLIAAHLPRYNKRSRPVRSPHWVKLTDERFPRLSMVRRVRDDGCLYLGPFRSRRAATTVVTALWDAVPVRRCTGRGDTPSSACAFTQLGVAICPCRGGIDEPAYREVVAVLRRGVEHEPDLLLEPLLVRMRRHAVGQRYEEAAALRDRHRALAAALERRREWQALAGAGALWAEGPDGEGLMVERGKLLSSWNRGEGPPLSTTTMAAGAVSQVPASIAEAEEARLLWRWLDRPGVRIVDSDAPLAFPLHPVRKLSA